MTMANVDSTHKRVDDPGLPQKRRPRRERKPRLDGNPSVASSSASAAAQSAARGSILWTLLLAGLVFSLIDLFYIANYLERTATVESSAPIKKPSVFLISSGTNSPKDDHTHPNPESLSVTEHTLITGRSVEKPKDGSKDQRRGPVQISAPKKDPSVLLNTNGKNVPKDDPTRQHPEKSPSEHVEQTTTGRSVEKPKDGSKGQGKEEAPIQISTLIKDPPASLSTKDDHPQPVESSSEHAEHTSIGRFLEQPKDGSKDQAKGPIQMSSPKRDPAGELLNANDKNIPKDDPPRQHSLESPSEYVDVEQTTTVRTVENPKTDSKGEGKVPIEISTLIKDPPALLSTKDMDSPKDGHQNPNAESSSKLGEYTATGRSVEKPKVASKGQAKGPIPMSIPIRDSPTLLSTKEMDSPKDDHPNPNPESSSEHGEHTTGRSVEQPKDDSPNPNSEQSSSAREQTATGRTVEKPKDGSKDQDKGPIMLLLKEAGFDLDGLDQTVIDSLPLWSTVVKLYGDKPRIVGLDTCEAFRSTGDPADHFLGVAGTFNTGTNLMAELFIANCHMPARMAKFGKVNRGIRWQVPWGKHTPVANETLRLTHKTEKDSGVDPNSVFPAVTVRDPAAWMQSMCRHEYAMVWPHNKTLHCPNLVPDGASDFFTSPLKQITNSSVPVTVQYKGFTTAHDSLLHHWNEYYAAYTATATFPHVVVRFEDLIFHPVAVTAAVCECAGGALNDVFKYVTGSAKKGASHGKEKTGYIDAIIRYGNDRGDRWKGMTEADLTYTRDNLDPTLMALFGYHNPPETTTTRI